MILDLLLALKSRTLKPKNHGTKNTFQYFFVGNTFSLGIKKSTPKAENQIDTLLTYSLIKQRRYKQQK